MGRMRPSWVARSIRRCRHGRTFLSAGRIVDLSVDGADIGDTVRLPVGGGTVEVVARARSTIPVNTLQLVHNGQVVAESTEAQGTSTLELRTRLDVKSNGWL